MHLPRLCLQALRASRHYVEDLSQRSSNVLRRTEANVAGSVFVILPASYSQCHIQNDLSETRSILRFG